MIFLYALVLGLNFFNLLTAIRLRVWWGILLSLFGMGLCALSLTSCTTATQSNSSNVNRTPQMRTK